VLSLSGSLIQHEFFLNNKIRLSGLGGKQKVLKNQRFLSKTHLNTHLAIKFMSGNKIPKQFTGCEQVISKKKERYFTGALPTAVGKDYVGTRNCQVHRNQDRQAPSLS